MDWGEVTKKTLIVLMWAILISSVIGGIIYCCYLGYEWTMRLRPFKSQGRHPQATRSEETFDGRIARGDARREKGRGRERKREISPSQRRDENPRPKDRPRRHRELRQGVHRRGRHAHGGHGRSFSSLHTSDTETSDGWNGWHTDDNGGHSSKDKHGQRRHRRRGGHHQQPKKVRVQIIRNKLDKFPKKRK